MRRVGLFTAVTLLLTGMAGSASAAPRPVSGRPAYRPVRLVSRVVSFREPALGLSGELVRPLGISGLDAGARRRVLHVLVVDAQAAHAAAEQQIRDQGPVPAGADNTESDAMSVVESDDRYVTVGLSSYVCTCGAHGLTTHLFRTFRRDTGALLPADFEIAPGRRTAFYRRLPSETRRVLTRSLRGFDASGTDISALRETPFFPRVDGLEVVFGDYQVASYAQGDVTAVIPWSRMAGVLTPGVVPRSAAPAPLARSGAFLGSVDARTERLIAASPLVRQAGLTPSGYDLVGPVGVQPATGNVSYLFVQLVPRSNPGRASTVVVADTLDETSFKERLAVIRVDGQPGCAGIPAAAARLADLACA